MSESLITQEWAEMDPKMKAGYLNRYDIYARYRRRILGMSAEPEASNATDQLKKLAAERGPEPAPRISSAERAEGLRHLRSIAGQKPTETAPSASRSSLPTDPHEMARQWKEFPSIRQQYGKSENFFRACHSYAEGQRL